MANVMMLVCSQGVALTDEKLPTLVDEAVEALMRQHPEQVPPLRDFLNRVCG